MTPWNTARALQLYDRTERMRNGHRRMYWRWQLLGLLAEMDARQLVAYRSALEKRVSANKSGSLPQRRG